MATAAAKRYAKAVFELATQDGHVERWALQLARLREVFTDPDVAAVLGNPTIPAERRAALIAGTPHVLDPEATNLARLWRSRRSSSAWPTRRRDACGRR